MSSQEAVDHVKRITDHAQQVEAGLIPADSPPDFVRPEGDAAEVDGKPWWFGPDYAPTDQAIAAFAEMPASAGDDTGGEAQELFD